MMKKLFCFKESGQGLLEYSILAVVVVLVVGAVYMGLHGYYSEQGNKNRQDAARNAGNAIEEWRAKGDSQAEPDQKQIEALAAFAAGTVYRDAHTSASYATFSSCGLQLTITLSSGISKTKSWMCGVTTDTVLVEDLIELRKAASSDPEGEGLVLFIQEIQVKFLLTLLGG